MTMSKYKNFCSLEDNHTLVRHKMTLLRNKHTKSKEFREILEEITFIVASQALSDISFTEKTVETPISTYKGLKINKVTILPIIRAGLGMLGALQKLIPDSKIGFLGIKRNHDTLEAEEYYNNIPLIKENETVIIADPMLATGNTIVYTLKQLKTQGVKNIIIVSIICSPVAIENILNENPDCLIYSAALDKELDKNGYITPGLGDAGDRIFNT